MPDDLSARLSSTAHGIGAYISRRLEENKGFGARSFYGASYSLALLAKTGQLTPHLKEILTREFDALDQSSVTFHWEFNQYGLLHYRQETQDKAFDSFLSTQKPRVRPAANWRLLKSVVLLIQDRSDVEALNHARQTVIERQERSGFITDQEKVRSFQYHCFSLALLVELWQMTDDDFFRDAFMKGVSFIRQCILSNGDALYVGRGQQQLFGYAALLYVLAQALFLSSDQTYLQDLRSVLEFVLAKKRAVGSFPLVFREGEADSPFFPNLEDEGYLGWYGYNNYFDYLSFAGFYFFEASRVLASAVQTHPLKGIAREDYCDGRFLRVSKKAYDAAMALPGGYSTNDLSFPYIVSKGKAVTPCYGGEEFLPSLYRKIDHPLPYFPFWNRTLHQKGISWLKKDSLHLLSPCGYLQRKVEFLETEIRVQSHVWSPFRSVQQFLFFDDVQEMGACELKGKGYRVLSSVPLRHLRYAYCALGRLRVYGAKSRKVAITVQLDQ